MKNHLAVILLLIACVSEAEKSNAQNVIRSIESSYFEAKKTPDGVEKGEQIFKSPHGYSLEEFNAEGKIIKATSISESYFPDENTASITTYRYDTTGCLLGKRTLTDGEIGIVEKYEYSKKDSLVKVTTTLKGEFLSFEEYKCDELGNRIENTQEKPLNTLYTYDSLGNILTYQQFDKNGNLVLEEFTEHLYSGKTKTEKWKQLNNKGEILGESLDVFDQYGNLIKHYESIALSYTHLASLYTYEYLYDEKGNWIKKIEFSDGQPMLLVERKIEYF